MYLKDTGSSTVILMEDSQAVRMEWNGMAFELSQTVQRPYSHGFHGFCWGVVLGFLVVLLFIISIIIITIFFSSVPFLGNMKTENLTCYYYCVSHIYLCQNSTINYL